ncbi:MAG TPA: hypothetical protein VIF62_03830 [Labilithrix sp.]
MLSTRTLVLLSLCSLCTLVACGGAPPPPPAPPKTPDAPVVAAKPIDTSPVPEPQGLLVVGRIKSAENIVKVAGSWAHLPLPSAADLLRSFDEGISDAVDLSQPIDGAITLSGRAQDPKVLSAIAVPVRSFDDASAKLTARHTLSEGPNGGMWINGIGGKPAGAGDSGDDDDDVTCMLAHGNGGDRIVCGEHDAVETLAPYLSRTLPKTSVASDFHVEIRTTPLRQYANQLRALVPLITRGVIGSSSGALHELLDSATGELVDFVGDTDKLVMDAQIQDTGAEATMKISYGRATSLLAKLGTSHPERADAPPSAFLHLPGDTDLAAWTRGGDPKLFDHTRELVGKAVEELTSQNGLPEPERKTVRDLLADKLLGLLGGPMVYGKGFDQAALDKAIAAKGNAKGPVASDDADLAVVEQIFGWHLVQVQEPIAKVGPMLKDWSALWNRPAFTKWAKERSSSKRLARMRIAPAPAGLPNGAVHLEILVPQADIDTAKPGEKAKMAAPKPITFHVIAVPDGGATWIGFGLDAKLLATKAAASLASAPDKDSLGKQAASEPLRAAKANGGALVTLRGLAVFTALDGGKRSPYAMLGALSNKGASPITFTYLAQGPSAEAAAGTSVSSFKLPRAAIEDIARIVVSGAR